MSISFFGMLFLPALDCRIRIGVRRKSVEFELVRFVGDAPVRRLKSIALKWPCLMDVAVEKLDEDPLFLYVADLESVVRQWRD